MRKWTMITLSAGVLLFTMFAGSDAALLQSAADAITNGGGHPILPPV
jgi:hypothetical protein